VETSFSLLSYILSVILALLVGGMLVYARYHRRIAELREENLRMKNLVEANEEALRHSSNEISKVFLEMSRDALKHNNEEFLRLAEQNLKRYHDQAKSELQKKEQNIDHMIKPIKEALEKTEQQIRLMEQERKQAYGSISQFLGNMAETQLQLQNETRNLVKALRRPEVRGQWGEMTLKRLVELAGMIEYCDFYEQEHLRTENGALRPDMIIRMPGDRIIVVDVKTPLDSYLSAIETTDDEERATHMKNHARKVRDRIRELSAKAYWEQFDNSPDFVVLFIPGDQFLTSALDQDKTLLEDAIRQRVILASPMSLVALLRTVAYTWRQEKITANAEDIRRIGEELYTRLATFGEHLSRLGKSLDASVSNYNKAVGSYDKRILPGARKFSELGISARNAPEDVETIEKIPSHLVSGADTGEDG